MNKDVKDVKDRRLPSSFESFMSLKSLMEPLG